MAQILHILQQFVYQKKFKVNLVVFLLEVLIIRFTNRGKASSMLRILEQSRAIAVK